MTNTIDYCHARNDHRPDGPLVALPIVLASLDKRPSSLLDIGCGTGTWLAAAKTAGIDDVQGVDGIAVPLDQLAVDRSLIRIHDLRQSLALGRRFDVVLCLEVAEHLDEASGDRLVKSLVQHADAIVFSAACPHQRGQHHVNCQWPVYWQERFNRHGFACDDAVRRLLWNEPRVEVWYRQNMFIAKRSSRAGSEDRLAAVVHPDLWDSQNKALESAEHLLERIREGVLPFSWYATLPFSVATGKLGRAWRRAGHNASGQGLRSQ